MKNLKTSGIYELTVLKGANGDKLAIGIKAPYRNRPQYIKILDNEFSRFKDFDHPNILKYDKLIQHDNLGYCLTMDWEEARPLADYVAEPHSEEQKKAIVTQLAEALDYIHARGCIHAALSPSVIYVTAKGDNIKIINFRQRYADGLKQPSDCLNFIAPEAKDGTVTLDKRADIFSLGQLVRYLDLPLSYQSVINGCCSFGRSDRFENIDTFLAAFNHLLPTNTNYSKNGIIHSGHIVGSKRKVYGLVAIAAIIVAIVVVYSFYHKGESTDNGNMVKTEQAAQEVKEDGASSSAEMQSAKGETAIYEGDMTFLNELMPQVKTDLDNIYKKTKGKKSATKKVSRYYKGLRKVLVGRGLQESQLSAFDQSFGDYNKQKIDELLEH